MRRKAFVVVAQDLVSVGNTTPTGALVNPQNIATIQPPAKMVVTRITVQVQGVDYTSATYYEILVSNNPPISASDGFKINCTLDGRGVCQLPNQFTFETFDDNGGIETTLYIANTGSDRCPIAIVYEGYYDE